MIPVILAIVLVSYVNMILNTWIISLRLMNKGDSLQMCLLPLQAMGRSQCPFPCNSARILWDS